MNDILTRAHSDTMRLPIYELVRVLNKNLGTTLVAFMADVRSRQLPSRWAAAPGEKNHADPRDDVKHRLQLAYQAFHLIEEAESEYVARQWLIGANPRFGGQTPAERIRAGNAGEVYGALQAFLDDTGGA